MNEIILNQIPHDCIWWSQWHLNLMWTGTGTLTVVPKCVDHNLSHLARYQTIAGKGTARSATFMCSASAQVIIKPSKKEWATNTCCHCSTRVACQVQVLLPTSSPREPMQLSSTRSRPPLPSPHIGVRKSWKCVVFRVVSWWTQWEQNMQRSNYDFKRDTRLQRSRKHTSSLLQHQWINKAMILLPEMLQARFFIKEVPYVQGETSLCFTALGATFFLYWHLHLHWGSGHGNGLYSEFHQQEKHFADAYCTGEDNRQDSSFVGETCMEYWERRSKKSCPCSQGWDSSHAGLALVHTRTFLQRNWEECNVGSHDRSCCAWIHCR